ncbi:unnamed protein product [Rotaria sp. Silwood2]|nr:unnamed protein product [Rotaria sp. Silwood2]CAF3937507.1 unnamed protein product [Rotaria sp. Silwood2]
MNKSNHFDLLSSNIKPENSSMTTVNILGRLRIATEQVRKVQSSLAKDGILYNLVDILSDDTRQSEINITSNDGQISKWLEQTFSSKPQRSTTAAARFESIKAVIQASSFVNALQRQVRQNAKERLSVVLDLPVDIYKLNLWSFNMMEYEEPFVFSILLIFDAHDIISRYRIDIDTLKIFCRALTDGYQKYKTPYHNDFHGADVLQTTHCLLIKSSLMNVFTQIEIAALLFSAAIHDYEHPGLNNGYLVKTKNDLALIYNDFSVLENHHASSIFKLLRDKRYNIWSNMDTNEYRTFRSLVISLVLATDMANHASLVERMSTYFFFKETNSTTPSADSKTLLQTLLHAADISNAAKPWPIYIQSAERIMEEFFIQGDLEKIHYEDNKPTFDRESTNIVQLQISFITHIVHPTFDVLSKVLQIDSLDSSQKESTATTNLNNYTLPWQYDLQLNLETWKQISKNGDLKKVIATKKPLKLNHSYIQEYIEKAKTVLRKRSQHDLLLNCTLSS